MPGTVQIDLWPPLRFPPLRWAATGLGVGLIAAFVVQECADARAADAKRAKAEAARRAADDEIERLARNLAESHGCDWFGLLEESREAWRSRARRMREDGAR